MVSRSDILVVTEGQPESLPSTRIAFNNNVRNALSHMKPGNLFSPSMSNLVLYTDL